MLKELPADSPIKIDTFDGHERITIPFERSRIQTFLYIIGFLVILLFCLSLILSTLNDLTNSLDSLIYLGGSGFGAFYCFWLYKLIRKPISEQYVLNKANLTFDNGVPPPHLGINSSGYYDSPRRWKTLLHRRRTYQFPPDSLETLSLTETVNGNKLALKHNKKEIEIAFGASEVEREWLFHYLTNHYKKFLPQLPRKR